MSELATAQTPARKRGRPSKQIQNGKAQLQNGKPQNAKPAVRSHHAQNGSSKKPVSIRSIEGGKTAEITGRAAGWNPDTHSWQQFHDELLVQFEASLPGYRNAVLASLGRMAMSA